MARRFSVILLLTILLSFVKAQTTFKGKAVDNKTGLGISFVTISLLSVKDSLLVKGQLSDSAGNFELSGIVPGKYLLLLSSFGYTKLYKEVSPENEDGMTVNVGIVPLVVASEILNEVTVVGSKPAFQRTADKLILNVSGNKLFSTAANTFDILKKVPGLEVDAAGAIQMLGRITPTVFIDGKLTLMSAEELQSYLAGLTPDMIASIEVITNPASKYAGEFKGIIDIKLKRDMTLGWKGNVNMYLQQNGYTLADNNISLTYKTKKVVYTTRLGYTTGSRIYRYQALQHLANTNIMATNTNVVTGNNNFNYQLGADYTIKKGQSLEVMVRAYRLNQDVYSYNTLNTTDSSAQKPVSNTSSYNNSVPKQHNYAGNINYSALLGGVRLDIMGAIVNVGSMQKEDIQNKNTAPGNLLSYWKTDLKNDILIRTFQTDLSGKLGKGQWSAGARFAFTTTENYLRYDTLNTNEVLVLDSSRTNNFQYNEYVTGTYLSYERTVHKWSYILGIRTEYTHSVADAVTQQQVIKRDYLTWLPSLSFTYLINATQQINFSFSRRMTRPDFVQLNPFRFYNSPLNYRVGNPYLQPSITNMVNITYTRKAFNVSLQFGRESDPMSRYPEYDSVTNVLEYLGMNLPYNDFAVAEINFPITVSNWWKMSNNVRGAYKKEQTPYHSATYAIPVYDYTISGSQVFTLFKDITFDVSYYYRSLSGTGLYILPAMANIDLGLRKSWMNGKLNSKINFYDIFDTYRNRAIFREKSIINNELSHWYGNRRVALTLNYSFGTSTHTSKQSRKNEEERRAGM